MESRVIGNLLWYSMFDLWSYYPGKGNKGCMSCADGANTPFDPCLWKKLKFRTSIVHLLYFVTKLRFKTIFSCTTSVLNFAIFMLYFHLCHKVHIYGWAMFVPSFKIVWSFGVGIFGCICAVCKMSCISTRYVPAGKQKMDDWDVR